MHTKGCWSCSDRVICLGCPEEPPVPPLVAPPVPPPPATEGKARHWKSSESWNSHRIQTCYPYWNHAPFCPHPTVGSCTVIWDDNHFLANRRLTQTTTASAFQLAQFSHRSWDSLKACCVFGKVQLCRHSPIKASTEQRSLFKAELFAFVYL